MTETDEQRIKREAKTIAMDVIEEISCSETPIHSNYIPYVYKTIQIGIKEYATAELARAKEREEKLKAEYWKAGQDSMESGGKSFNEYEQAKQQGEK